MSCHILICITIIITLSYLTIIILITIYCVYNSVYYILLIIIPSLLKFDYKAISICKLQRHIDLDYLVIYFTNTCPIYVWVIFTLHQLIYSDLNSKDGIRVIPENPNSNPVFSNLEHTAVLRQYCGCDLLPVPTVSRGKNIPNRYVYAFSEGTTSVGTDPTQFVQESTTHYGSRF